MTPREVGAAVRGGGGGVVSGACEDCQDINRKHHA